MPKTRPQQIPELLDKHDFSDWQNKHITIAVPDATRAIDVEATLRPLLERLHDQNTTVTCVVALGLHRPMTASELSPLNALIKHFGATFIQHDANGQDIIELSKDVGLFEDTSDHDAQRWPLPAHFHRALVETDHIVCVGLVEPHQYAGFSGGVKTVGIGCAGHATISAMHGLTYLRDPNTTLGVIEGNPFQRALWRTTSTLNRPIDVYQFVPGANGFEFAALGPAATTFPKLVHHAQSAHFHTMDARQQWVHLPVSSAKASNFYQASRAATYISLVHNSIVEPQGWILLDAHCAEGVGHGAGEEACAQLLSLGKEALYTELLNREDPRLKGGQQRAFVIANALQQHHIALIGAPPLEALRAMDIPQFESKEAALHLLGLDPHRGCTLHDVIHQIPTFSTHLQ